MNANNWPLEEMEQVVFEVAYSPKQCAERVKAIDEPRYRQGVLSYDSRYRTRTNVELRSESDSQVVYGIQRVHYRRPIRAWRVYSEANVALVPTSSGTRVTLYFSDAMTKAEKWWIIKVALNLVPPALIGLIILLVTGYIFLVLGLLVPIAIAWYFLVDARHFRRQRNILRDQLYQAFDLPDDPTDAAKS